MATLFIADLHLCVEEPAITAGFLRFLAGEARKADALYILGDLFEAWIATTIPTHSIARCGGDQSGVRFRRSLLFHSWQP